MPFGMGGRRISQVARDLRQRLYPPPDRDAGTRLAMQLAVEGLLAAIVLNLATVYASMFASRMGASDQQIGYLSSLPQLFALTALIPGAVLTGRMRDRRRPVEVSLVLAGLFYGLAGFAPLFGPSRVWFLIGMIALASAPLALYNASWQNYFSDIVPVSRRNNYYTLRTSMTFFAGIVVVQVIGLILGGAGSDSRRIQLYQICYWISFAVSLLQLLVLRRAPRDLSDHKAAGWQDLRQALREILCDRRFRRFFSISLLFHSGFYMAWPLFFLSQVNYMKANETWLSYISVSAGILQWLTVRPWGRYIERHGIRKTLIIGTAGLAVNPVITVACAFFAQPLQLPALLIFSLVNACTYSAYQLAILQCLLEAVPIRNKALNLSIYTSALLLANAVMPMIGVRLYLLLGGNLPGMAMAMAASSLVRLLGTVFFWVRWRQLRGESDSGMRA